MIRHHTFFPELCNLVIVSQTLSLTQSGTHMHTRMCCSMVGALMDVGAKGEGKIWLVIRGVLEDYLFVSLLVLDRVFSCELLN